MPSLEKGCDMKRIMGTRGIAALILSVGGLAVLGGATSSAAASPGAVTRTFSFVGKANGHTVTVVNIDSLLINARCDGRGFPVVFGFTSANASDLFAHVFDAFGRVHIIKNTSFTKHSRGVQLSTSSGDFDATGVAVFEEKCFQLGEAAFPELRFPVLTSGERRQEPRC